MFLKRNDRAANGKGKNDFQLSLNVFNLKTEKLLTNDV